MGELEEWHTRGGEFDLGFSAASKMSSMRVRSVRVHPNKRLKLTAHVAYGINLSPVRCSLSAIR